jgi:phosphoglycerate dehydrogenase-like enzyme
MPDGKGQVSLRRHMAILDDYQDAARQFAPWSELADRVAIDSVQEHIGDEDDLAARLFPYDILLVMRERTPLTASLIERLPNLKLVISTGVRNRSIDLKACAARGVLFCATGSGPLATSELAWGLILALARRIPAEDRGLREGHWQLSVGEGLAGGTLGVVGLGQIGRQVAQVGRAFDMRVLAWSSNLTHDAAQAAGAELVSKADLLRRSDFVTLHMVLSERTTHLIAAPELALMKPTAFLINTARAGLVDTLALVEALEEGRIAGAGIDVFDQEPIGPDAPLLKAPNTVLTPHLGYVTRQTYERYFSEAFSVLRGWLDGQPPDPLPSPS